MAWKLESDGPGDRQRLHIDWREPGVVMPPSSKIKSDHELEKKNALAAGQLGAARRGYWTTLERDCGGIVISTFDTVLASRLKGSAGSGTVEYCADTRSILM